MSSEFGQFLDDLPDLNLSESKKPKRSAAYFINLHGISKDTYKDLVQLDAWLDTPEKLSQWRAIVDAVLQRVQRYEKRKHKQSAKHPWPLVREPRELNLQTDEDLEALCLIVSLWHDQYTSGYPVLTAEQEETIRKWPYRPCSYGAGILPQWFVHLHRYVKAKGLVKQDLAGGKKVTKDNGGKSRTKTEPEQREVITLIEFMDHHCQLYKGIVLRARRDALYEADKRRRIKLPKTARPYARGRANVYYADDLHKRWGKFSQQVNLPSLQSLQKN